MGLERVVDVAQEGLGERSVDDGLFGHPERLGELTLGPAAADACLGEHRGQLFQ